MKTWYEKTVGILGGGQLARMTVEAAHRLGVRVAILENEKHSPAGQIAAREFVGHWSNQETLESFAHACDVITLENEFVDANILHWLETKGLPVFPSSYTLALIQDKAKQKHVLYNAGLPGPPFTDIECQQEINAFAKQYNYPLILKACRNGYDGRGNYRLDSEADIAEGCAKLGYPERELLVEAFVPFVKELAVMVVRGQDGTVALYPVVETIQRNHICHTVTAPADIAPEVAENAQTIALKAIEAIKGVGVFGVEMFLTGDNQILINELAPRPHNSGHYTIEACQTSQFENLLRVVLDLPIGSTKLIAPAVMVNLLGKNNEPTNPKGVTEAYTTVPELNLHLYGKKHSRIGRKMGHLTVLAPGSTAEVALTRAEQAAALIEI
jgi:5-(carboxyamino)imidazole ribonucleotide synthase